MKEHNLLAEKYNCRVGKYDSSKGPQNRKAKNRLHQNLLLIVLIIRLLQILVDFDMVI